MHSWQGDGLGSRGAWCSARPGWLYARRIESELQRNQRPELSDPVGPHPSGRPYPDLTCRHGEGARTATDAAFRVDEREASSVGLLGDVQGRFEQVRPRGDEAAASRSRRRSRQAWAEIARAVRRAPTPRPSGASIGRVEDPRSEGSDNGSTRSAPHFVETVFKTANHPGEARALRTLPIQLTAEA